MNAYFRFPFVASEIFNCEINSVLDKFFDAPPVKAAVAAESDNSEHEDEEEDNTKDTSSGAN